MLMSGLEKPTTGRIFFDNDELSLVSEKKNRNKKKEDWINFPTILSDT